MATIEMHEDRLPRAHGPQIVFLLLTTLFALGIAGTALTVSRYQHLVQLDRSVQTRWIAVEEAYQQRADLAPGLVDTVRGTAGLERQAVSQVTKARIDLQPGPATAPTTDDGLTQFEADQNELGVALAYLAVKIDAHPALAMNPKVRSITAAMETTNQRIAEQRDAFNEAANTFNSARGRFPDNLVASLFGTRFSKKATFRAQERPPEPAGFGAGNG
jgi:LemA protein